MKITAGMVARGRSLAEPRWSPDGERLAYLESFNGRGDVVVVPANGGAPVRLTAEPGAQPTASYGGGVLCWIDAQTVGFIAPDGHLHAISVQGGPARQLTQLPGRAAAPAASPDGRRIVCMVTTKKDQHIAHLDPSAGAWPELVSSDGDFKFDPVVSADGSIAWQEWNVPNMSWDGGFIRLRTSDGEIKTVDGGDDVSVSQPRFSPDGRSLAYVSDRSGWWNLWLYDLDAGQTRHLLDEQAEHGGPTWGPGGMRFAWSPDGRQIAFVRSSAGRSGVYLLDLATGTTRPVGPQEGSINAVWWSPTAERLAIVWGSASRSTRLATLDIRSGSLRDIAIGYPAGFESAETPSPEAIDWATPDGATAHGLFYRPTGVDSPPLLVLVHGGPNGHVEAGFNARTSYWVDRGWAVLQVNYRGSSGYGRAYLQALREYWGIHDVTDTVSGARHLADQGLVDGDRMAVMGGSAGGFTVLLCLALHPDVFAAGVDLFGVADLFKLAEETHRFEAHYMDTMIGPLPDQYQRYVDRSPLTVADKIQRPLLILQGDKDEVVPLNQSEAIRDRLQIRGVTVEMHVYEGEGHGWQKLASVTDELERATTFLRRHVLHQRE